MTRALAILVPLAALLPRAQTPVILQTFDKDTEGWITMGTNGAVKVSNDAHTGAGALQYTYSLDARGVNTAILPTGAGRLTDMRRVRLWIKTDHDTAIGLILPEKKPGGGDYIASFWLPKDTWQHVELPLSSFFANDGPADPVDSDGRLDPDQVEGIGIIDLANFFHRLAADSPMIVAREAGMHSLWIDDFEILSDAGSTQSALASFSEWITPGGIRLASTNSIDNPIGGPAIIASIQTADGKLALMTRRVDGASFAGMKRIAFDIAAEHEGTFALSIETKKPGAASGQGPRYTFLIYPPENRKVFRVNVALADFDHDANSPEDPAGQLEAGRMKSISIGDISALTGGAAGRNTVWIGRIEMLK